MEDQRRALLGLQGEAGKTSHRRYAFGLGLEGYVVAVCPIWEEKLGRQRRKGLLRKEEIF